MINQTQSSNGDLNGPISQPVQMSQLLHELQPGQQLAIVDNQFKPVKTVDMRSLQQTYADINQLININRELKNQQEKNIIRSKSLMPDQAEQIRKLQRHHMKHRKPRGSSCSESSESDSNELILNDNNRKLFKSKDLDSRYSEKFWDWKFIFKFKLFFLIIIEFGFRSIYFA
jgi:hypothetical protein